MLMIATKRPTKFYFNGFFLYIRNKSLFNFGSCQDVDSITCQNAPRFATLITKLSILTEVMSKINKIN
jgi:hypothetical protein